MGRAGPQQGGTASPRAAIPARVLGSAVALGAAMGTGWAHRAWKPPREAIAEPRGLETVLSAGAHLCPPATAMLQPLRPAGMGKGMMDGLTAQLGFFTCLRLILFGGDSVFF